MITKRSTRPLGPWAGRDARVDRAARVAKGQRGAAIDVPRANGSPFSTRPPLAFVRCNDFKDATKAATLLPQLSRGVTRFTDNFIREGMLLLQSTVVDRCHSSCLSYLRPPVPRTGRSNETATVR
jgi:hypothetical protein